MYLLQNKIYLHLLPPETKAWALLTANERTAGEDSARKVAEADVKILKGFFKNYTVRPKSWTESTINEIPAIKYTADYEDKDLSLIK